MDSVLEETFRGVPTLAPGSASLTYGELSWMSLRAVLAAIEPYLNLTCAHGEVVLQFDTIKFLLTVNNGPQY